MEVKRRWFRRGRVLVPLVLLLLAWGAWSLVRPSHERDWKPEHARLPAIEFAGDTVTIHDLRNFDWTSIDTFVERYETRSYELSELKGLWFGLSIFHPDDFRGPAHSLLSFEFDDGRCVAISVEARKEVGEGYSIYKGMAKRYELIYVIGDERDLLGNRAVFREDQLFLYPIRTQPEKLRALFTDMLKAAERLRERPEFYNTVTNNCTTRLRDHANEVTPGRIPPSWKILFPGYSDELLSGLGLLDSGDTVEAARRRFDVKARAREAYAGDDFSREIRDGLQGAQGSDSTVQ